jgi:putative redox protein
MADALEVTATWKGGYEALVSARGHEVTIDEPETAGGHDAGPMPTEALAISIASCFCLAVAHVARRDGHPISDLQVHARAERAGRELRYGRVVVTTRATVDGAPLEKLVERARRVCWVSNTLADPPALEYRSMEVP